MWTLIITSVLYMHGTGRDISTYEFYSVKTEARCHQYEKWINERETYQRNHSDGANGPEGTKAICVKEE